MLERHPGLRVGFLESGCGWLPYWLWRMDGEYEAMGWEVREQVRMKPSDYFQRQCFIICEPTEPGIEGVIDLVGEGLRDALFMGTALRGPDGVWRR